MSGRKHPRSFSTAFKLGRIVQADAGESIGAFARLSEIQIHAIVDARGNRLVVSLTGGQADDVTQAETFCDRIEAKAGIGDKDQDADAIIQCPEARSIQPVIPPKSNRELKRNCDFALYHERICIEGIFSIIKQIQGIAARNGKQRETSS